MKRIMILAAMLLLAIPAFCNEILFSQSASYMYIAGYSDNSTLSFNIARPSFGSNTKIDLDTEYVDASISAVVHNNNKTINMSINPKYELTDNLTVMSNINYRYSYMTYRTTDLSEHALVANMGLSLKERFWIFDIKLNAYVGYTPIYLNFRNLCETGFDINIDVSKYISIYFGIESFQSFMSVVSYNPVFVKNTCLIEVHYTFENNITIFANWTHFCAHPEIAWATKTEIYNKSEGFVNLGIRYSLPF